MKSIHKIIAVFAGMILLVALGGLSFWSFSQMKEAAEARKQVFVVINSAGDLLSALKDAESGQRGYLLTGDTAFLAQYSAVHDSISVQLEKLRQLTSISAAREQLNAVSPLLDTKLAEMSHVIELGRKHDMAAALAVVRSGQGKQLMDGIRAGMSGFIRIEQDSLTQHEAVFQSNMRRMFTLIVLASLFTLLFAMAFVWLIYRESQQRLKNLVLLETQHLLEVQEETNKQLQFANTTLQVSEEKLAVTLSSIGDAVIATDAEARVTLINPVAESLTGWTQAAAVGRPVDEIFHIINQETRQLATIPVIETLAKGTIQGLANHTVLISRDGSECAIADSCAPIHDRDGRVVGAVLVFRNVTEEYAAQQALRDSAALIQTILNTVVDGIITLHARGGLIETVNPAAEQMFGYTAAELIGQNFSQLIPEFDQDQHNGSLEYYSASAVARATGLGREVMGRHKDGRFFPLEISVSEMWLGGQRYFTGILRDISMRKRVEAERTQLDQRLRDQQFYTRSLIESNIDAIMTTDPSGIITDANKQMEILTDCTRDELIGAPLKKYFTDPEQAEAAIKRVLGEKKLTDLKLVVRARNGKKTVVSFNATTFFDRYRTLQGVFAVARDVTERNHLDQALLEKNVELERAKFVAEKANLAKSDFLSSMSHELRTPLNAILGFAQLLEAGSPPPTATQVVRLHQIIKAGWYLLELINEILDLALIESGKLSLSREPVSLIEVIRECQAMVESQAQQHGILVKIFPFDNSWFAYADRTRVKQVLINLLSNAIKYNTSPGTVEVRCTASAPGRIRISIRDSGAGLSPEQLAQLFQTFNRLGQENGVEEGTGIGLVVTKQLVALMGGTIGVESTVGVGSKFWIELIRDVTPQLDVENTLPEQVALHAHGNSALSTLLYVEDNLANLMLVEQIIEEHPHVRMLSARDIEKGLEAGFFRYLTKPIKVNEFMSALDDALKFSKKGAGNTTRMDKHDD